jgi:ribosome-binding factor A
MRQIPDLEFRDDRSMEYAEQIARALREVKDSPVRVMTVVSAEDPT